MTCEECVPFPSTIPHTETETGKIYCKKHTGQTQNKENCKFDNLTLEKFQTKEKNDDLSIRKYLTCHCVAQISTDKKIILYRENSR